MKKSILITSIIILVIVSVISIFKIKIKPNKKVDNSTNNSVNSNIDNNVDDSIDDNTKYDAIEIETNDFENLENYNSYYYKAYLNYSKNNLDIDKQTIVYFINYCRKNNIEYMNINDYFINLYKENDFDAKKIDRYIYYLQNSLNSSYENVVKIVNNNLDTVILKNKVDEDFILNLINEKYYKSNNLERYINYFQNNKSLSSKEIVTNVNSNLDYTFYKDYNMTDTSKDTLMIVNKHYKLDNNYVPENLVTIEPTYGYQFEIRQDVYEAFKNMYNAAKSDGISMFIVSPYRSYKLQNSIYNNYVAIDGINKADTYSARPGFSEHQSGLAVDLAPKAYMDLDTFVTSPSYNWMIENSYKYGFILRYPQNKEYITGYMYEPWHYRYVGVEAATIIKNEDLTFEEYYEYYVK